MRTMRVTLREAFARVLPILKHLGKNIVYVGAAGAGQVVKAANQIIVGLTIEAVAEALAFRHRLPGRKV